MPRSGNVLGYVTAYGYLDVHHQGGGIVAPADLERLEAAIHELLTKEPRRARELVEHLKREGLMDEEISSALVYLLSRHALRYLDDRTLALAEQWPLETRSKTPAGG